MLQKLVKTRKEALDIYLNQGRSDLATIEEEEIEVLSEYLPSQISASELTSIIEAIIEELNATSMKDMGRVMGIANQKLAGRADGKMIAQLVKSRLS